MSIFNRVFCFILLAIPHLSFAGSGVSDTLMYKYVVNVKDFGAKGNGVNDDTRAINNAISEAADGSVIYFPTGDYLITSSIRVKRSNIELLGDSSKSVIIVGADRFIPLFIQSMISKNRKFPSVLNRITVKYITIDANGLGQDNAGVIVCNGVKDYLISDNIVHNSPPFVNGIAVSQPGSRGVIRNNVVFNCGKGGIYAATYSEECLIEGNIVHDIANGIPGAFVAKRKSGRQRHTVVKSFGVPGIQIIGGVNTTVRNNIVYNCSGSGIYVITGGWYKKDHTLDVPLNCDIRHNICKDNRRFGIEFGNSFGISDSLAARTNGEVKNNRCFANLLGGIMIENRASIVVNSNLIYGNGNIRNKSGVGVMIRNAKDILVSDNKIFDNCRGGLTINSSDRIEILANSIYRKSGNQVNGIIIEGKTSMNISILGNSLVGTPVPLLYKVKSRNLHINDNVPPLKF